MLLICKPKHFVYEGYKPKYDAKSRYRLATIIIALFVYGLGHFFKSKTGEMFLVVVDDCTCRRGLGQLGL